MGRTWHRKGTRLREGTSVGIYMGFKGKQRGGSGISEEVKSERQRAWCLCRTEGLCAAGLWLEQGCPGWTQTPNRSPVRILIFILFFLSIKDPGGPHTKEADALHESHVLEFSLS